MASPVKKASSFEACKHFQKGPLRAWCFEGFASVYNVVNASLKQSKVAAEAELAIQAAEELIFESEAGAEEGLDADLAAEGVASGVVGGEVDRDEAVDHIVKDEADAQMHVAFGENVVVIGVDAQVDANRAVAELKPGNNTNEPLKIEDLSMLWQLELGVEANAVQAVGEQLKLETIMDTLKSEPNLTLLGSKFDYSRSRDLETNHEAKSYTRAVQHASIKTAPSSVPDSPFRDKHNLSRLPSCVPAPNDSGLDLNLNTDSNIVASIDRGGTFLSIWNELESNRCREVEGANMNTVASQTTCFEEDTPIIITDDDGSSDSCFAPLSELMGYQDTGMNSIISSHPCVDLFDELKHLSSIGTQSRYDASPAKDLKFCALAWSPPPMHLSTIDRRVMHDYVGQEDPSSAALCTGIQTWNSDRFDLRCQAQRCRSLRSQLNCFVDPRVPRSSSLYFQVCFKLKAKYNEDAFVKRFRLGCVPEQASQLRWIDALSNNSQLVAVTSNTSSRVKLVLDSRFSQSCLIHMMSVYDKAMDLCVTCWLYRFIKIAEEQVKPLPSEVSTSIFFDTSWPIFILDERMLKPSDRGPFYEHTIDSSTVRREFSPDAVLGIEVILLFLVVALLYSHSFYTVSNSSFYCSYSFIVHHSFQAKDCRVLGCRILEWLSHSRVIRYCRVFRRGVVMLVTTSIAHPIPPLCIIISSSGFCVQLVAVVCCCLTTHNLFIIDHTIPPPTPQQPLDHRPATPYHQPHFL
jgi:hypothetical protein